MIDMHKPSICITLSKQHRNWEIHDDLRKYSTPNIYRAGYSMIISLKSTTQTTGL